MANFLFRLFLGSFLIAFAILVNEAAENPGILLATDRLPPHVVLGHLWGALLNLWKTFGVGCWLLIEILAWAIQEGVREEIRKRAAMTAGAEVPPAT